MSNRNTSFEPYLLMATGGEGAHVILNCLPKNFLNASIRCIAEYGRFLQMGKFDYKENNTFGMSLFLKNTSFTGIIPEEIMNCTSDEKQALRNLVQDGIRKYVVRPIRRTVVEHENIVSILE